ncbi:SIMPL domain-containing protein [Paracoccaceae bacterium Fryx2]|nr:SIMPL domain-containing protein [Paracoccaceae bacterium Fryx2]
MRVLNALLLATSLTLPVALPALAEEPRLTVTGEGRVDARPDMATISLGVTTQGATAAAAMAANSDELGRVLANLRRTGIEERDVQTSGLSLNPNWVQVANDGSAPVIKGYVASNMLTVRVRALETLGGVLDAAVKDGANTLNGVTFGLTDPAPAMDEARTLAVADALARARLLAGAAGVRLGPVVSITEGGGYSGPAPMFRMAESVAAVPMAEGEVAMSANVTVVFGLTQ